MIIIVVVDEFGGMMFNARRQSKDEALRKRIWKHLNGKPLFVNAYSAKQFQKDADCGELKISESFLEETESGDFCFVENLPLTGYEQKIEKIILYNWNRDYPRDTEFDIKLDAWEKISSEDFVGNSHEKITEEIYIR